MCNRLFQTAALTFDPPGSDWEEALAEFTARMSPAEQAPTETILGLGRRADGSIGLSPLRWGLIPGWWREADPPRQSFNARIEEAADKPTWRRAVARGRCIIPVGGWFEWSGETGRKQRWRLGGAGDRGLYLGGLYDRWTDPLGRAVFSCAICTAPALAMMADLNDRMPVVLTPDSMTRWLDVTAPLTGVPRMAAAGLARTADRVSGPADLFSADRPDTPVW